MPEALWPDRTGAPPDAARVWLPDAEATEKEFPASSFDLIVCQSCDVLRDPLRAAADARLAAPGRRAYRFVRQRPLPRGPNEPARRALDGRFGSTRCAGAPGGRSSEGRRTRFFTRREVEKLLFCAGFVAAVEPQPTPEWASWVERGRGTDIDAGALRVEGLPPAQAEEFLTPGYTVVARHGPHRRGGGGCTSIVIVTHNELYFTRQCLAALAARTDPAYEVIVVDNASTDGSAEYLARAGGRSGAWRVIQNAENRGFPAAANQGIVASRGEQILLLNNDVVVTTGWLDRMLDHLYADPRVGLVGPCSNRVSGAQQVDVTYTGLADLDGFAWEWGKAHDRRSEDTDRLVGFCLLVRREVVTTIGLLDERFGVGNFEDDDYCRRAGLAGYRAVIARDTFVHHFGSRTFLGSGIDLSALMRRNERLFRDKWVGSGGGGQTSARAPSAGEPPAPAAPAAPAAAAGPVEDLPPGTEAPPPRRPEFSLSVGEGGGLLLAPKRPRLSLCMIVRDSAQTFAPCLRSIRPFVDEIVVVDTGSRDRSRDIAREWAPGSSTSRGATISPPPATGHSCTRRASGCSGWTRTTRSMPETGGACEPWWAGRSTRRCSGS